MGSVKGNFSLSQAFPTSRQSTQPVRPHAYQFAGLSILIAPDQFLASSESFWGIPNSPYWSHCLQACSSLSHIPHQHHTGLDKRQPAIQG